MMWSKFVLLAVELTHMIKHCKSNTLFIVSSSSVLLVFGLWGKLEHPDEIQIFRKLKLLD